MKDPIQPTRFAELLGALAAPERIRIVRLLSDGERNVSEIAKHLHTAAVNVAHHLAVLKQAGMIRGRKQGRFVYYALAPGFLQRGKGAKDYFSLGGCRLEVPRLEHAGRRGRTDRPPASSAMSAAPPGSPVLTACERRTYDEQGFLVFRGLFPAREIAAARAEAEDLVKRKDLIDTHNLRCRWQP
jgi:DNA-binding transcriptional ArsR family regulator